MESWRASMTSIHHRLKYKYKCIVQILDCYLICVYFRHNIIYLVITKCKHALIKQLITKRVSCASWWQLSRDQSHPSDRCAQKLRWAGKREDRSHCIFSRSVGNDPLNDVRLNRKEHFSGIEHKPEGPLRHTSQYPSNCTCGLALPTHPVFIVTH